MDLLINIALAILAAIGSTIAIAGKTWDDRKPTLWKKLTKVGRIALTCLASSFLLGVVKEVRSDSASDKLSSTISRLDSENEALLSNNEMLRENLATVQGILVQRERLERIYFHVNAFDGDTGVTFNTLVRLFGRTHPGRALGEHAVGIRFSIQYGYLELHVVGVGRSASEEWYYKLCYFGEDRATFYKTPFVKLQKESTLLIRATLGDGDFEKFWQSRPQIVSILERPESTHERFNPRSELGRIEILGYGILRKDIQGIRFAMQEPDSEFVEELSIPRKFLTQWHVLLDLNNRQIREVEQVLEEPPPRIETKRLLDWKIDSIYLPKENEALIAPVGAKWTDFSSAMNGNLRELLYGKREGLVTIEPKVALPTM